MVTRKKMATTAAATFGAAIATIYTAPELNADILGLTFSPTSTVATGATGSSFLINEVGASFRAWNSAASPGVTTFGGTNQFTGGLTIVQYSQYLTAGAFGGATGINYLAPGINFLGFAHNGNVGWFQVNVNLGGTMVFGPGEYGTNMETLHVGGTTTGGIPEPTSAGALALLALGATGIRRRRKQVA